MLFTCGLFPLFALALLGAVCPALTAATGKYTTQYDNIDLDRILRNDRVLKKYVDCLMDRGKCTPDAAELKKVLPDALKTECSKCSPIQKKWSASALSYILTYKRNYWNELLAKYDPNGEYRKKHGYKDK